MIAPRIVATTSLLHLTPKTNVDVVVQQWQPKKKFVKRVKKTKLKETQKRAKQYFLSKVQTNFHKNNFLKTTIECEIILHLIVSHLH